MDAVEVLVATETDLSLQVLHSAAVLQRQLSPLVAVGHESTAEHHPVDQLVVTCAEGDETR